jgi:hypothetical protein
MRRVGFFVAVLVLTAPARGQNLDGLSGLLATLPQPKDYVLKRVSSYDRTGANADRRQVAPG